MRPVRWGGSTSAWGRSSPRRRAVAGLMLGGVLVGLLLDVFTTSHWGSLIVGTCVLVGLFIGQTAPRRSPDDPSPQ